MGNNPKADRNSNVLVGLMGISEAFNSTQTKPVTENGGESTVDEPPKTKEP